ncbi:hypothetical protein ACQPYK_04820 [Streptosporangium sp. CA-135522]|uniref:hypothetical protein n=1 Tax=Streptosporangium sp. CA-135522 TaxID=3240072 RepID=UPI003D8DCDAA
MLGCVHHDLGEREEAESARRTAYETDGHGAAVEQGTAAFDIECKSLTDPSTGPETWTASYTGATVAKPFLKGFTNAM